MTTARLPAPWGLLGMIVLVALGEGFVASQDLRFARIEPDDWRSAAAVAQGALPSGGVLILGDSQVKFGISPLEVEAAVGQPVECLAIQGGQAPAAYFLFRRALRGGMVPSAVVVNFEPHLLRDPPTGKPRMWAELGDLVDCFELSRTTGRYDEFAAMVLGCGLPTYRARSEIQANLMAAFRGETSAAIPLVAMARRNRGMNRGAILMSPELGDHQHDLGPWGNPTPTPWRPAPANDRYVRRLLRLALDHQIPVYATLMPLAPGLNAKYERSGIDAGYAAWLGGLQARFANLRVLDWRHADLGPLAFFDALHLNARGASAVSAALGDHLNRVSRGELGDRRWTIMPTQGSSGAAVAVEDSARSDALMRAATQRRR